MENADSNKGFAASPRQGGQGNCGKTRQNVRSATHRLVISERTTKQRRNNKCVMISMSCVMTVTRLAWHPREHTWAPDIVDDRVQEEGALQPRLVPLRVHQGGLHGPAQELLLEEDAVDVLHCGSTQKKRLFGPGDESAVLIIVLHTSSVLVTVHKKKAKINSDRKIIMAIFPEFMGISQDPGYFTGIGGRNKKTPVCNHFRRHGSRRRHFVGKIRSVKTRGLPRRVVNHQEAVDTPKLTHAKEVNQVP